MSEVKESQLWKVYLDNARNAFDQGEMDKAEELLSTGLNELTRGVEDRKYIVSLLQRALAKVCHHQGKYSDAESLYKFSLAMLESHRGADNPEVAGLLSDYALLLSEQGRMAEAIGLRRRAMDILIASGGADSLEAQEAARELAALYLVSRDFAAAEPLYEMLLASAEAQQHCGPVAQISGELALICYMQGRYADAEAHLRRAVSAGEAPASAGTGETAHRLMELGLVLCAEGRHQEGQTCCARASAVKAECGETGEDPVASQLSELADVYCRQGQFSEAGPLCRQAFELRESGLPPADADLATVLASYACLLRRARLDYEADRMERRARELAVA